MLPLPLLLLLVLLLQGASRVRASCEDTDSRVAHNVTGVGDRAGIIATSCRIYVRARGAARCGEMEAK